MIDDYIDDYNHYEDYIDDHDIRMIIGDYDHEDDYNDDHYHYPNDRSYW
jgi:hypothetical protein